MITRVVMPPLGETMDEGTIARWVVSIGDKVEKGDTLLEVESDKSILDVESFGNGILRKIVVPEGETVPIGTLIAVIAEADEDISGVTE